MEDTLKRRLGWVLYGLLAAMAVTVAVQRWMLAADVRLLPMGWLRFRTTLWASALLAASATMLLGKRPSQALGMALITVPLWGAFWGFINSIPELVIVSDPLPAQSREALSRRYIRSILYDLSYLGAGFLLWARPPLRLRGWARALRDAGFRTGAGEGASLVIGIAVFPLLLLGTWGLDWFITSQTPQLINGDESAYWSNMTMFHAVMISAAAAFTEELVYRVAALGLAVWAARRLGASASAAAGIGVASQAVLFAMAHGGYGTWAHVLFPALFGLLMGALVLVAGVWAAVAIHFLIDFFVFGSEVAARDAGANVALWLLLAANVAMTLWVIGHRVLRWQRTGIPPWQGLLRIQW